MTTEASEAPSSSEEKSAANNGEGNAEEETPAANNGEGNAAAEKPGAVSYLAEITAYEVLKAAAIRIGRNIALVDDPKARILVVGDQCLAEHCLPMSDLVLHHIKTQIDFIEQQVNAATVDIDFTLGKFRYLSQSSARDVESEEGGEKREEKKKLLYEVVAGWLTGWSGAAEVGIKLVKQIGAFLGQFSTTFTIQERKVTLPLEALVAATAGAISAPNTHLLSLSQITVQEGSVIKKLTQLIQSVHNLDEARIKLDVVVVKPLTAEASRLSDALDKNESTQATLKTALAATSKRIEKLKKEAKTTNDPDKLAQIQKQIDTETENQKALQKKLSTVDKAIEEAQASLKSIKQRLLEANEKIALAANLTSGFNTFFQNITTAPDKATLSPLAKAVLREHILTFPYLLRLSIHSGGGEMIERKFAWWSLKPTFVGGCALSYALVTTTDGRVVQSGLEVAAGQRKFSFNRPTHTALETIPVG